MTSPKAWPDGPIGITWTRATLKLDKVKDGSWASDILGEHVGKYIVAINGQPVKNKQDMESLNLKPNDEIWFTLEKREVQFKFRKNVSTIQIFNFLSQNFLQTAVPHVDVRIGLDG